MKAKTVNDVGGKIRALCAAYVRQYHPHLYEAITLQAYEDLGVKRKRPRTKRHLAVSVESAIEKIDIGKKLRGGSTE